jgi:hypothetical protein
MRKTMLMFAIAFAANANAVIPDSGWYFNPNESGRGFNIEIQNNTVFIAGFLYDANGKQMWVFSGGPMSSDHTYSGDAFVTADGQPIDGLYRAPTTIPFGTLQITWPSDTTNAIVVVNGRTFIVTRELFGFDFNSTTQPLLGELSFVEGISSFFGDRLTLTTTQVINGAVWAIGHKTGDTGRVALGRYDTQLRLWTILLDASAAYWDFFTFSFEGVNFVEGSDYTYLKGSNPSGSHPMVGYRTKSQQRVVGQNAPGSEKAAVRDDEVLKTKTTAARIDGTTFSHESFEHIQEMEAILRSIRK